MDDSFSNVVLAIMWGRCVNDSVKKFLQFQISSVLIMFVLEADSLGSTSPLSSSLLSRRWRPTRKAPSSPPFSFFGST